MAFPPLTRTRQSNHPAFLAEVLRRLATADRKALDPWLPFPQNGCSYAFGRPPRPLPIGALRILWDEGPPFRRPCPACRDQALMISMGGLLTIGGGRLICPACAGDFFQSIGSLSTVAEVLGNTRLAGTPFAVSRFVFGGSVGSDGAELLTRLGLRPVLQEEWGVVVTETGERTRRDFKASVKRSVPNGSKDGNR